MISMFEDEHQMSNELSDVKNGIDCLYKTLNALIAFSY